MVSRRFSGRLYEFVLFLSKGGYMFSVREKREIAEKIQKILRDTNHPELPEDEIRFNIHVDGKESWSWADIKNNGACINPGINEWNEFQEKK